MNKRIWFLIPLMLMGFFLNAQRNTADVHNTLLNNIWYWESSEPAGSLPPGPYLIKFFDNGNMIIMTLDKDRKIPAHIDVNKKYTLTGSTIGFRITGLYEGILNGNTISGTENTEFLWGSKSVEMNFSRLTDPELLKEYSEVLSVDLFSLFPEAPEPNDGPFPSDIYFINTFDFYVAVLVLGDEYSFYHLLRPNDGSGFSRVNDGEYEIYYIYYNDSGSLYKGNNISVNNQEVTITLKNVPRGNYSIQKID